MPVKSVLTTSKLDKGRRSEGKLVIPKPMDSKSKSTNNSARKPVSIRQNVEPPPQDDKISKLLKSIKFMDENEHTKRASLLEELKGSLSELTEKHMDLCWSTINAVLTTTLPFAAISKGYKQIYFGACDCSQDITSIYEVLEILMNEQGFSLPESVIKLLVRRVSSASSSDRMNAKRALMRVDPYQADFMIHACAVALALVPPYGTDILLELMIHFMNLSYSQDDTLFNELQQVLHMLHFAPHYHTFSEKLLSAVKTLNEKDERLTHENRLFLLNNWPRLDPPRALLFLQEATDLCTSGPPVDPLLWQKFSWRASSIQWQIATEGMNFIEKTIGRMEDVDFSVLKFLLDDTKKNHWCMSVRDRAEQVLKRIPEIEGKQSKTLNVDVWKIVKETAQKNYPRSNFSARRPPRKRK